MDNILENIIDKENKFEDLSKIYQNITTETFSEDWELFDFQENAIKNAISVLDLYYNKLNGNKKELFDLYLENGLNEEIIEKEIDINNEDIHYELLREYFNEEKNKIKLKEFINRMSFWMATGSGKTLVMIKLIEVLANLISKDLIPKKDILILAPKDEILNQIEEHIDKFNTHGDLKIVLNDLRDFEKVKNKGRSLFDNNYVQVFYYRADNIRDENKEKLVNYRSYYNNGNWYLFVDEAHKGGEKESTRQQYYKILSSNGFLFNFSATFTEVLDKATTCYNLKLSKYISKGYGKHLKLANSTFDNFEKEKFENEDRKKIILKSLILFTVLKKYREKVKIINPDLYHEPLLTTLTNEVNTKNAELKVFFRELAAIAKENYDVSRLDKIKDELRREFNENRDFYYEDDGLDVDFIEEIDDVSKRDILKYVFNADNPGTIEVTGIEGNKKELAFSLTSSSKDFACIVIGDASKWKNDELEDYYYNKDILKESYLDNIEDEDNNINILLGSRVFTEGWDTNRLNIVNYINIGVSSDSQKYILQSIGRGLRIEPITHQRKRLDFIDNEIKTGENLLEISKNKLNKPLETLFIFSTNRTAIDSIIRDLEKEKDDYIEIEGIEENKDLKSKERLIPIFKKTDKRIKEPYSIAKKEYEILKEYIENNLKLIPIYTYNQVKFRDIIYSKILDHQNIEDNPMFEKGAAESQLPVIEILKDITGYFNKKQKEFDKFEIENGEIKHFSRISANIEKEYVEDIENKLKKSLKSRENYIKAVNNYSELDESILSEIKDNMGQKIKINGANLIINSSFLNHYYNPIIYSSEKKIIEYFKNIITVESEIKFLEKLNEELEKDNNIFEELDWWGFSKVQEREDDIYIPYFDRQDNKGYRKFYPDFIFWLRKDNEYKIIFVDPKSINIGTGNAKDKIDGYKKHLEYIDFKYNGQQVKNNLYLFNQKKPANFEDFKNYWSNDFEEIFKF
jgi:superfamily II DNA or RNA helicase